MFALAAKSENAVNASRVSYAKKRDRNDGGERASRLSAHAPGDATPARRRSSIVEVCDKGRPSCRRCAAIHSDRQQRWRVPFAASEARQESGSVASLSGAASEPKNARYGKENSDEAPLRIDRSRSLKRYGQSGHAAVPHSLHGNDRGASAGKIDERNRCGGPSDTNPGNGSKNDSTGSPNKYSARAPTNRCSYGENLLQKSATR